MNSDIEYPAFPQPKNLDENIWRYLDFSKFEWMVENNCLFMPRADKLGDPLEGTQPIGDLKWWEGMIENESDATKRNNLKRNKELIFNFSKVNLTNYYVSSWYLNSSEK